MSLRKLYVYFYRFCRHCPGLWISFVGRDSFTDNEERVRVGQPRVCSSITGIESNCLLKKFDASAERFFIPFMPIKSPLQIKLKSLWVIGVPLQKVRFFSAKQLDL